MTTTGDNGTADICGDDDLVKEKNNDPSKLDMADGVPHMRGLNRKQAMERNYRDQDKGKQNGAVRDKKLDQENNKKNKIKGKEKTGLNEKVVDCMYVGLMCCECSIQ